MRIVRCDWRDCHNDFKLLQLREKDDGRANDWITLIESDTNRDHKYESEVTLCPLHAEQFKNSVRKNDPPR